MALRKRFISHSCLHV